MLEPPMKSRLNGEEMSVLLDSSHSLSSVPKAVLKPPQSKRCRDCSTALNHAKRLDCGEFTAALQMQVSGHDSMAKQ
jgi:hypothetical protein